MPRCGGDAADSSGMDGSRVEALRSSPDGVPWTGTDITVAIPSGCLCVAQVEALERFRDDLVYDGHEHTHDPFGWGLMMYPGAIGTHIDVSDNVEVTLLRDRDGYVRGFDAHLEDRADTGDSIIAADVSDMLLGWLQEGPSVASGVVDTPDWLPVAGTCDVWYLLDPERYDPALGTAAIAGAYALRWPGLGRWRTRVDVNSVGRVTWKVRWEAL